MSSTEMDHLEAKLAETKASYDKIKQFADLLYNQGIESVTQISSKYQTLLTDMHNLREEQHQLSQDLNSIKLNQKVQQIEELTAENQLLHDNNESGEASTFKTEHVTPGISEPSRKRRRMSASDQPPVKSTVVLARVEIPVRRPSPIHMPEDVFTTLDPEANADEDEYDDDQMDNDQDATAFGKHVSDIAAPSLVKPPTSSSSSSSAATASDSSLQGSSEIPSHVDIVVHKGSRVLMLGADEPPHLQDIWREDGQQLQRHWNKQVEVFDEKNPQWHKLNAKVQGCVRSTLFQAGKCNFTIDDPGVYACKTCWNTSSLCVGWDVEAKLFFLRPQLPVAIRSESNPNPGPFDVESYESGNPKVLRRDVPKYWE